jgi:hypothetical protein
VVRTDPVLVSPVTKVGASPPIQLTLRETDMARAYQVLEGDVVLIDATRNPMTEAAALLLERGEPRSTKLEFRFEGEQQVAMSRWVGHQ